MSNRMTEEDLRPIPHSNPSLRPVRQTPRHGAVEVHVEPLVSTLLDQVYPVLDALDARRGVVEGGLASVLLGVRV